VEGAGVVEGFGACEQAPRRTIVKTTFLFMEKDVVGVFPNSRAGSGSTVEF